MAKIINDPSKPLLDMSRSADYATVCEITEILSSRYDFLNISSIGETILQKKLLMFSIGNINAKKSILYVSSSLGSEWITTNVLLRFINELCEYYKNSKQPFGINLQAMLSSRCLYFVPLINVDGVDININGIKKECIMYDRVCKMSKGDYSHWNANCRGVDLSRNYSSGFWDYKKLEEDNNIEAGASGYSGTAPFSEPESGALANYIRYSNNISALISLRAFGEEIIYAPLGAKSLAEKLSRLCGYKISYPKEEDEYGSILSWFVNELERPAFTVKCTKAPLPIAARKYFEIYASIREMLFSLPILV